MKYDYKVKHNGIYYMPGEEVPIDETPIENEQFSLEDYMNPPETDDNAVPYTKTDISKMNVAELRNLAESLDIDATLSGAKLKSAICKHYGL